MEYRNYTNLVIIVMILLITGIAAETLRAVYTQISNAELAENNKASRFGSNVTNLLATAPPSVTVVPTVTQSLLLQTHISLDNASINAQKVVGKGAHSVAASIVVNRGSLVYAVWVLDTNNIFHRVLLDAASGKAFAVQRTTPLGVTMLGPGIVAPGTEARIRLGPGILNTNITR